MDAQAGLPSTESDRELVLELARLVLEEVAPEEVVVLEETAAEYFEEPEAVLDPKERDQPVAFGLELSLLTPYVLAVVTPVVRFLLETMRESLQEQSKPVLARFVRLLFRHDDPAFSRTEVVPLSADQARRVRAIALDRAMTLGLPESQASLLADAVVGGVTVAT